MTSKVTTVYNQIRTKLATLFSSKSEIPFPEDLLNNDDNFLRNGYGVLIRDAIPAVFTQNEYYLNRVFGIILTKEVVGTKESTEAIKTCRLDLAEEQVTLINEFDAADQLEIDSSIEILSIANVSPIEIVPGNDRILMTTVFFTIGISETRNT